MQNKYGKNSILKNIIWKLLERGSSLVVTLGVNIVLARLLAPSDFGLAAMIMVFVALSTIFVTGGPANALIQMKDADEVDFSSIFWLNIAVSAILYVFLFVLAPGISLYYGYPQLNTMLRVLGLNVIISAINSIQGAYIARNMMFRHYFFSTFSGKVASGVVGIGMALLGFGVWSLIGQSLCLLLLETIILWLRVKWRPRKVFAWERVKKLYSFAWRIMLMTFVESISEQLRKMLIGKKYTSEDLAYYDKGFLFPTNIITNIAASLSAVMFPVLANVQDEGTRSLDMCRRWTGLFAYTALPLLAGMMAVAQPLITVMLTDKWLPSVPYMQLACLVYAAWTIEIPIRETIKSLGFADICLKMQVIKTGFALLLLLLVMNYGVMAIALSAAVGAGFNIVVSMYYANKYIAYSPPMLWQDVGKTFILNAVMGVLVFLLTFLDFPNLVKITLQVVIGIMIYLGFSILTKNEHLTYLNALLRDTTR